MDTALITLILPVVLFIITLIIILALRAEDKRSRSLQTVKEKILSFRNESQQTVVRIQETCHDCTDKINSKKAEAEDTIRAIDFSLETLKNHKRDLAALESVCKSYELALEKLKLQTEHAESRISVVQKEVEKAEMVSKVVDAFKEDAARLEDDLKGTEESYRALVSRTEERLQQVSDGHVEKEKELLKLFSDELSRNREEFGVFIDEIRDDIAHRRAEIDEDVRTYREGLSNDKSQLEEKLAADLKTLNEKHDAILADVDKTKAELDGQRSSFDEYFAKAKESSEEEIRLLEASAENGKSNLSAQFTSLNDSLKASREEMEKSIGELKARLDESLSALSARSDQLAADAAGEDEKLRSSFEKGREQLSQVLLDAENQLKADLRASADKLAGDLETSLQTLSSKVAESTASIEKTRSEAVSLHNEQKELISKEEGEYVTRCIESLRRVMAEELEKVDGVFKAMSESAEQSIGNLGKRQSEIKEAVSLLNQGTNETIAATVDRLQNLQARLNQSETSLSDTQKQVTAAKEELYNLQAENRSLQSEVLQSTKALEDEQNRLNEAKSSRMAEEARIVKLKLEEDSIQKEAESAKSEPARKKEAPAQQSFEFVGDEEEIPLDDDN